METEWSEIVGGKLVSSQDGCGVILAGESLYFSGVFIFLYFKKS